MKTELRHRGHQAPVGQHLERTFSPMGHREGVTLLGCGAKRGVHLTATIFPADTAEPPSDPGQMLRGYSGESLSDIPLRVTAVSASLLLGSAPIP